MLMKAVRWIWLGFTLTRSFMIFLRLAVVCGRSGDEPCEDFDRESLEFVLQSFPDVDVVEQQVEEIRMSRQGRPPFPQWNRPPRFGVQRGGRGEHPRGRLRESRLPESQVSRSDS